MIESNNPRHVVNVRTAPFGSYIYIGRAMPGRFLKSIYANPFKVGRDGERGECVEKYRRWLAGEVYVEGLSEARQTILRNLPNLAHQIRSGLSLGCWCAPQACHGDVLVEMALAPAGSPGGAGEGAGTARKAEEK